MKDSDRTEGKRPLADIPYVAVCALLGLVLGWLPKLAHGPIPQKFDVYFLKGAVIVWAFYCARMLIGFWVGVGTWPAQWYLRGPLFGFLTLLPITFVSLGTPNCGPG